MKKLFNSQNKNNELWINWLTRKLNSYEPFEEFELGKNPEEIAEKFMFDHRNTISEVFEKFDEDDKDTLDQFYKLTECEWHIYRILKSKLEVRNKVRYVDFKKGRK